MAETVDPDTKTEDPTEKRFQDAAEKGNDPVSREVPLFASLAAILIVVVFFLDSFSARLTTLLKIMLDSVGQGSLSNGLDLRANLADLALKLGLLLAPVLVIFILFGLAAFFVQALPRFVSSRIQPELKRISPLAGFDRIFGKKGWFHFLKSFVQLSIVGFIVLLVLRAEYSRIIELLFLQPAQMPEQTKILIIRIVSGVAAATALIVAADLVWTRMQWLRDLRMTKQEVKDELKQAEGDPMVKARLRSIALDRARKRMMAQVPRATLVIANPTHYAIALRYVREEGGAPLVVAKGQDLIALKIREIAEQNGVPVIEQKLLARSMYHLVEIDQVIPPEFYRAVAELIHYLSRNKKGLILAR